MTKLSQVKNKTIVAFMVAMLAMNFYAWTAITVKSENTIKEIYSILKSCEVKNG